VLPVLHPYVLTSERTFFQAFYPEQSSFQTPSQKKFFRALCEMNAPVMVPIRLVVTLKTSLCHDLK